MTTDDSDRGNRRRDGDERIRNILEDARSVNEQLTHPIAAGSFDVKSVNEYYAVVIVGGRAVILEETWKYLGREKTPTHERIRFLAPDALERWCANQIYLVGERPQSAAQLWLKHPERRQYRGVIFDPSLPPGGADVGGYYNLWQGFSVEPDARATCDIFLDHLRINIANGNEAHAAFIFGTLADMLQNPTDRKGIALVLRGRMGTGKTMFGTQIGRLIEGNYALVDDPRYITGNFNAHLASLLLLQADEGFWAGDKLAEGRLKGLITSDRQMIELKGKDPIQVRNFIRLLVTSNADWVVPASYEERRFAVFDVGDHCMQNHEYFASMAAELEGGGYGRLLYELLHYETATVELRRIPNTRALFEQKIESLPPVDSWWFSCLQRGWITWSGMPGQDGDEEPPAEDWPVEIEIERVYRSYVKHCDQAGVRHRKSPAQLGFDVRKLVPGVKRGRKSIGRRPYVYYLPDLADCRHAFERRIGTAIDWETAEPLSTPPTDEEDS